MTHITTDWLWSGQHRVTYSLDGPGEIVATDNGDPTDMEAFVSPTRRAFSGLCLVIVRAKRGEPGTLRLTASGAGVSPASAAIVTTRE